MTERRQSVLISGVCSGVILSSFFNYLTKNSYVKETSQFIVYSYNLIVPTLLNLLNPIGMWDLLS